MSIDKITLPGHDSVERTSYVMVQNYFNDLIVRTSPGLEGNPDYDGGRWPHPVRADQDSAVKCIVQNFPNAANSSGCFDPAAGCDPNLASSNTYGCARAAVAHKDISPDGHLLVSYYPTFVDYKLDHPPQDKTVVGRIRFLSFPLRRVPPWCNRNVPGDCWSALELAPRPPVPWPLVPLPSDPRRTVSVNSTLANLGLNLNTGGSKAFI